MKFEIVLVDIAMTLSSARGSRTASSDFLREPATIYIVASRLRLARFEPCQMASGAGSGFPDNISAI